MHPVGINIERIKTLIELASLFDVSEEMLQGFIDNHDELVARVLMLKNRSGEYRKIVFTKSDPYRIFLRTLSAFLYEWYSHRIPDSVHGFVKRRSIITNAQQHTQKKSVTNIDIKHFFESITFKEVHGIFIKVGFQDKIAGKLTELVTVDGVLAAGFATSPVLSNIACLDLDEDFKNLANEHGLIYTRYADDITLSSNKEIPSKEEIKNILIKYGFEINENKYRIYRRGGPQYVTGLSVVDKRPRLSKKFKRRLRLELYYIKKYGFMDHWAKAIKRAIDKNTYPSRFSQVAYGGWGLEGFAAFIHSVEPKLGSKIFKTLLKRGEDEMYW
ncbi:MAG: RNA-directed DNA polymerase [Candidatus Zambryskibacteria bacterium]|nr:RNA-directed DNA polymerase [Candidatus Zambryskibacteria bacterium]